MSASAHSHESGESMSVAIERDERTLVVKVSGEIDLVTSPQLEQELTRVLEERPEVLVLDITRVTFLSSAGLAVLVSTNQHAGERTRFRVAADDAVTLRPIQLMGLDSEFPVYPSMKEAVAA
ncbi:anti-anti-sigma factor [Saccharopolyspora lacisalsi]|uniref:Anti-sigma factor antagonist n=1 Tax=Halosaccharopolyspora lacisalsi TaxID=1000566 RepID=A0A839DVH1_9PSEU|nr:STAS domain-containing protein [Halosaccharopolyspora lacisalsi]MBA8822808.1 anti-anti-sigma factor [Halosaccharopolyspora lacisalsi]